MVIPEGIELMRLPLYSPELQPAERLWALSDDPLANRVPANLDALEDTRVARCKALMQDTETVRRHTLFHWWSRVAAGA